MPKARKWVDLKARMSPESRARVAAEVERMEAEMPLHRVREALALTQAQLAQMSGMSQPSISQIEQRADVLVGTLERYLGALNVQLRLVATLPDSREVVIRLHPRSPADLDSQEGLYLREQAPPRTASRVSERKGATYATNKDKASKSAGHGARTKVKVKKVAAKKKSK